MMQRVMRVVMFCVSIAVYANLYSAAALVKQPKTSFALLTDFQKSQNFNDEIPKLGNAIKSVIYRVVNQSAQKAYYARGGSNEIKVYPGFPHYTHLFLGDVAEDQMACINETIIKVLQDANLHDVIDFNLNTARLKLLKGRVDYYVIAELKLSPKWNQTTQRLNDVIEKQCPVRLDHYVTYQANRNQWIPHVSLFRIRGHESLAVKDKQGKTVAQHLEEYLSQLPPLDLGSLAFKDINLSKKVGSQSTVIAQFEFNKQSRQWKMTFGEKMAAKAPQQPCGVKIHAASNVAVEKDEAEDEELAEALKAIELMETQARIKKEKEKEQVQYKEDANAAQIVAKQPAASAAAVQKEIRFKPVKGTAYFALTNGYDGSPAADPLVPHGVKNYTAARGLGINQKYKTSDELYQSLKLTSPNDGLAMIRALEDKFNNDRPELVKLLLDTGNAQLINASEHPQWGLGADGKGKNLLGKYLMGVRDLLRVRKAAGK